MFDLPKLEKLGSKIVFGSKTAEPYWSLWESTQDILHSDMPFHCFSFKGKKVIPPQGEYVLAILETLKDIIFKQIKRPQIRIQTLQSYVCVGKLESENG